MVLLKGGVRLSSLPPAFQPAFYKVDEAGRKPGCSLERLTPPSPDR
jgi:hypothetical protein